jgi:coenzyme F420 biosynthesis associated uncharacterized protein
MSTSRRAWGAGFVVGSVIGAAATVIGRRAERSARRGLVDWPTVERIAVERAGRGRGALAPAELRAVAPDYATAMAVVVPRLASLLGAHLPGVTDRVDVVSRADWIRANRRTFESLFSRIEGDLLREVVPPGGGLTKATVAIANRYVATRQLGYLLGFMGQRVLGQYDLALLSAETVPGRLLFVEENIRATAAAIGVPITQFRTWIALHETTHAFEFEANAWLRPYLAERLERSLELFSGGASSLGRDALRALGRSLRGSGGDHWLEWLMSDEQRRIFNETQAAMSILEGFGDYVMDEAGREFLPDVERISERFHARREHRTGVERAILRITGMDLKLDQYKRGETFIRHVADARGRAALARLWDGPSSLPTSAEIARPEAWIARVLDGQAARGAS